MHISLQFDLKNSILQPNFKKAQTTYSFLYIHILILEYLELYIFKRLDNDIIFLFSSIYASYFLFSLALTLQFPYVSFPPLSYSLCFSFHVLPFMSLFSRFFYLPHISPFVNISALNCQSQLSSLPLFQDLSWRAGVFFTPLCTYKIYRRYISQMRSKYRALRKIAFFFLHLMFVYPLSTNNSNGLTATGSCPLKYRLVYHQFHKRLRNKHCLIQYSSSIPSSAF